MDLEETGEVRAKNTRQNWGANKPLIFQDVFKRLLREVESDLRLESHVPAPLAFQWDVSMQNLWPWAALWFNHSDGIELLGELHDWEALLVNGRQHFWESYWRQKASVLF